MVAASISIPSNPPSPRRLASWTQRSECCRLRNRPIRSRTCSQQQSGRHDRALASPRSQHALVTRSVPQGSLQVAAIDRVANCCEVFLEPKTRPHARANLHARCRCRDANRSTVSKVLGRQPAARQQCYRPLSLFSSTIASVHSWWPLEAFSVRQAESHQDDVTDRSMTF